MGYSLRLTSPVESWISQVCSLLETSGLEVWIRSCLREWHLEGQHSTIIQQIFIELPHKLQAHVTSNTHFKPI